MGSYKEIKGDLIQLTKESNFDIICHGANCQSIMGSGIAKQIRKNFPDAYLVDKNINLSPIEKLGNYSYIFDYSSSTYITNLYTQFQTGANFNYIAFEMSLIKMCMTLTKTQKIGLPQIGCGIGGAEWDKVKEIIQRVLVNHDVTIVIYDK